MVDRSLIPSSPFPCVLATLLALVVGCAGDISAPEAYANQPEADGGEPAPAAPLEPGAWQALDFAGRARFMREVVMPTMEPLFVESDAERYATFTCRSCHGHGASDGTFSMPSSDLPVLGGSAAGTEDVHKQRVTDFMRNTVKPKMAELLGDAELRCSKCHPSAE